ncbi:MAG: glycerol-3-phosphate dehydrogenase [Burkholderiales bacterium]
MSEPIYDLAVIGGGINGAGIARDAAGRGLRVVLFEQHDLAAHTSSASTKLIHGGLRYLEHFEFMLVRKALQEREVILKNAPHITWPMRFVVPHNSAVRPEWMVRAGLFLYDHLARRERLPDSETVDLRQHEAGQPLRGDYRTGFIYSDGWVDDARLVLLNALDARERGARIHTRACVTSAQRHAQHWDLSVQQGSDLRHWQARAVVNAAGPWAGSVLSHTLRVSSQHRLRLVKGSHIVVPALFQHDYAYLFQNEDNRVIFAIPYEGRFTLIGTTDVDYDADAGTASASSDEVQYLCAMASRYFARTLDPSEVVHSYAGVRPLLEDEAGDASSTTRDYWLELNTEAAPLLSVLGGKITTYRKLAEEALHVLAPYFGSGAQGWTHAAALPGGDMPDADFAAYLEHAAQRWPWLSASLLKRYAHAYGTRLAHVIGNAQSLHDLGPEYAPGVYEAELHYARTVEFCQHGDDFLWRRSKLGLHLTAQECQRVQQWFAA